MELRSIRNKKGQFESRLLAIIIIIIIGIILFFFSRLNSSLYSGLDKYFNDSETYNNSEAHTALTEINTLETSNMWDYVFLAVFIGIVLQIILFSFAGRANPAFYWIMIILDIPILIVGVVLSNIWQGIADNPQMVDTVARFPITNFLLGTYYPVVCVIILFIALVVLLGKSPSRE